MSEVGNLEFKINIQHTTKEYIDNLILGLVHSGYYVYFDFDFENICFNWSDEIITEKVKILEKQND
jgi:hypothetical protein